MRRSIIGLAALISIVGRASVRAQTDSSSSASYALMADSSDNIRHAIDQTVESMNFIVRPIARGRLNHTNPTPQRMRVMVSRDSVGVAFDDGNPVVTPKNGVTVPWANSLTHETYQAHMTTSGDTVAQTIAAPDGTRVNAYILSDGGERLSLRVTVSSHRLPKALVYTLRFRKST